MCSCYDNCSLTNPDDNFSIQPTRLTPQEQYWRTFPPTERRVSRKRWALLTTDQLVHRQKQFVLISVMLMRTSLPLISNNCCSPQKFILLVVLVLSCPTKALSVHRSIRNLTDVFCFNYCRTESTVSYVWIYFCHVNEDKFPINIQRLLVYCWLCFSFPDIWKLLSFTSQSRIWPMLSVMHIAQQRQLILFFVMRTCFPLHGITFFIAGQNISCVSNYLSTEYHVMALVLEMHWITLSFFDQTTISWYLKFKMPHDFSCLVLMRTSIPLRDQMIW